MGRVADTRYRTAAERFRAKCEPQPSGCWLWTASTLRDGYGSFTDERGKTVPAHVWAYQRWVGPVEPGQVVMHTCDTPSCVRSTHLRLGTQAENIADKMAKGREARGAGTRRKDCRDILVEDAVRDIRALNDEGLLTQTMIGELYGLKQGHVSDVVRKKVWAWVA